MLMYTSAVMQECVSIFCFEVRMCGASSEVRSWGDTRCNQGHRPHLTPRLIAIATAADADVKVHASLATNQSTYNTTHLSPFFCFFRKFPPLLKKKKTSLSASGVSVMYNIPNRSFYLLLL